MIFAGSSERYEIHGQHTAKSVAFARPRTAGLLIDSVLLAAPL
jgi:hypothetical protein